MIKDITKGITTVKELQALKADIASLPTEGIADGSSVFVVDTFEVLVFHDGHWYDGTMIGVLYIQEQLKNKLLFTWVRVRLFI